MCVSALTRALTLVCFFSINAIITKQASRRYIPLSVGDRDYVPFLYTCGLLRVTNTHIHSLYTLCPMN